MPVVQHEESGAARQRVVGVRPADQGIESDETRLGIVGVLQELLLDLQDGVAGSTAILEEGVDPDDDRAWSDSEGALELQARSTANAVTLRVSRLNSTPIRWIGSPDARYLSA